MQIEINNLKIEVLGDPHLGRSFRTGVPLDRIGEREESQWETFNLSLHQECDLHVCMGDIFDKFIVAPEIVLDIASQYRGVARHYPERDFVIIRGNHDGSKDLGRKSSFDLLTEILENSYPNIIVVREEPYFDDEKALAFFPWHPTISAEEMMRGSLEQMVEEGTDAVFGHWEVDSFGGEDFMLCPYELIKQTCVDTIVTGHVHIPEKRDLGWAELIVTGSMQPYSHAEDLDGDLYITVSLEELEDMDVSGKNVRILLKEGEEVPADLDCLSLTVKPVREVTEEGEPVEVEIGSFDLQTIFDDTMKEFGVSDARRVSLWNSYMETKTNA